VPADDNLGDIEDPFDFTQLSEHLIVSAAVANDDEDVIDVDPLTLTTTIPLLNLATHLVSRSVAVKVSIPLRTFFKYPTNP
jgi:hypothetical protein